MLTGIMWKSTSLNGWMVVYWIGVGMVMVQTLMDIK